MAGLSGAELAGIMDQLYDAAQRQGAPLEAMVSLYGRAAQAQAALGASNADLVRFSEDVGIALRVAGTSASEASGALLQLGQLLGSSRVQAEEFNSINDAARPILQAVADGLIEAGGSVSKLKALVSDGQVSNTAFFQAFQVGAQAMRDRAAEAEPTISQAFERVQNAIIRLVGELNNNTGASEGFIDGLNGIADGMRDMAKPILEVIGYLQTLAGWLNTINQGAYDLGKTIGDFLGTTAIGDVVNPAIDEFFGPASSNIGPSSRNSSRSQLKKPVSTTQFPVIGSAKPGKGGGSGSRSKGPDEYARETKQIQERIEAMQLEAEALGKSTYEAEKAKVAHDLLNAAKEAGKAITPELTAQIDAQAEAYARTAEKLEKAKDAYQMLEEVQDGLASAFSGMISAVRQGEDAIDALTDSLARMMDQLLDMIAKQLFKQLFAGMDVGGLFGFSGGGTVGGTSGASFLRAATGGSIRGPGSGTSDSIPAMLSDGEFVVRAAQARKHRALLEAINSGARPRLPSFATGGSVGGPVPRGGFGGGVNLQVVNQTGVEANATTRTSRGPNGQQMIQLILGAVKRDMVAGGFDQPMRGRFATTPAPVRRG